MPVSVMSAMYAEVWSCHTEESEKTSSTSVGNLAVVPETVKDHGSIDVLFVFRTVEVK